MALFHLIEKNLFVWHKPANKLISFWFTGLPTVTSATPAYKEIMNNADEKLYCFNDEEWIDRIHQIKK